MNSLELLRATVGHERFTPKNNRFKYHVFYVVCPVEETLPKTPALFSFNRFNVLSMRFSDHGARDGSSWRAWVEMQCRERGMQLAKDDAVLLIAHPRLFGYGFNPISYWLIFEKDTHLKAVICEVHNTFGDDHTYFLAQDGRAITESDVFAAKKNLYVSPYTTVAPGSYTFSFTVTKEKFKSVINYFENDVHILNTYMGGTREPLSARKILRLIVEYPLMTLLVIYRIHYQAVRLYFKGVKHTLNERPPHTSGKTTVGTPKH